MRRGFCMSVYLELMVLVVVVASGQLGPADMPPGLSVSCSPTNSSFFELFNKKRY